MIEKYFPLYIYIYKINNNWQRSFNWINLKLKELQWMKEKLEDWNKFCES